MRGSLKFPELSGSHSSEDLHILNGIFDIQVQSDSGSQPHVSVVATAVGIAVSALPVVRKGWPGSGWAGARRSPELARLSSQLACGGS